MDKIKINNMNFYGFHGVNKEEKILGQRINVDVTLYLDLNKPCLSDNIDDTVSYAKVFKICKNVVENTHFNLMEALAQNIIDDIKQHFYNKVSKVSVKVKKIGVPVNGIFDNAEIRIKR